MRAPLSYLVRKFQWICVLSCVRFRLVFDFPPLGHVKCCRCCRRLLYCRRRVQTQPWLRTTCSPPESPFFCGVTASRTHAFALACFTLLLRFYETFPHELAPPSPPLLPLHHSTLHWQLYIACDMRQSGPSGAVSRHRSQGWCVVGLEQHHDGQQAVVLRNVCVQRSF